jgi:ubiquinone/menaquinone biosynthesis C-methylase UbiE
MKIEYGNNISGQLHGEAVENEFEHHYINLRKKEGRIYNDEEVRQLPLIDPAHPLKKEWEIRKISCLKLVKYLSNIQKPLRILEVGCGNGWLSNQLSEIKDSEVVGIDVNNVELAQAKRVFLKNNLSFLYGQMGSGIVRQHSFDIIVFAASFQYFQSAIEILDTAFDYLKPGGEIHITDTVFYSPIDSIKAKQRSEKYFISAGFPAMNDYYFHHSINDLKRYNYKIFFNPELLLNKLLKKMNPFYWICIYH